MQLIKAAELYADWQLKKINDYTLIKEYQNIIHELSDSVIKLETEKAELKELLISCRGCSYGGIDSCGDCAGYKVYKKYVRQK